MPFDRKITPINPPQTHMVGDSISTFNLQSLGKSLSSANLQSLSGQLAGTAGTPAIPAAQPTPAISHVAAKPSK